MAPRRHKYTELFTFYGDPTEWEAWKAHLITKIRKDFQDFPEEIDKIDYARDKLQSTARDTIWHRAKPNSPRPFRTLAEMMEVLENNYAEDERDKRRRLHAELLSPSFHMSVRDRAETFEAFVARFNAAVSPLNLPDDELIDHFKRTLSDRLKFKTYHLTMVNSFHEYVRGVRSVANELKLQDDSKKNFPAATTAKQRAPRTAGTADSTRNKDSGSRRPGYRSNRREPFNISESILAKLPKQIVDKLRKAGRCFKCGQKNHIATDADAPCRDKPQISRKDVEALLSELNIDYTDADLAFLDEGYVSNEEDLENGEGFGDDTQSEN